MLLFCYLIFLLPICRHGRPQGEIVTYIEKITVLEDKFDMYTDIKAWGKAADVAFKLKDDNRLIQVGRVCGDQVLEKHIQAMLNKL